MLTRRQVKLIIDGLPAPAQELARQAWQAIVEQHAAVGDWQVVCGFLQALPGIVTQGDSDDRFANQYAVEIVQSLPEIPGRHWYREVRPVVDAILEQGAQHGSA